MEDGQRTTRLSFSASTMEITTEKTIPFVGCNSIRVYTHYSLLVYIITVRQACMIVEKLSNRGLDPLAKPPFIRL